VRNNDYGRWQMDGSGGGWELGYKYTLVREQDEAMTASSKSTDAFLPFIPLDTAHSPTIGTRNLY